MSKIKILLLSVVLFAAIFTVCGCGCSHQFDDVWQLIKIPTQTERGVASRTCKKCGEYETIDLAELTDASFWDKNVVDASHDSNGEIIYTSVYGKVELTVDKIDHDFSREVADARYLAASADCFKAATYYKSCVCGAMGTETFEYGEPLRHEPTFHPSNGADCESAGNKAYFECTRCGKLYRDKECSVEVSVGDVVIDALGHDYGDYVLVKEPTLFEFGELKRVCLRDDEHEDTYRLPQLTSPLWKQTATNATYFNEATIEYVLDKPYVKIVKTVSPKLVAPYDGKTYDIYDVYQSAVCNAQITFDIRGNGVCDTSPFEGGVTVTSYNANGELTLECGKTVFDGKTDLSTSVIMVFAQDVKRAYLLYPRGVQRADVSSVRLAEGVFAVVIRSAEFSSDVYVENGETYFDVSYVDADGSFVSDFTSAETFSVIIGGETLTSYKNNDGVFIPYDPTRDYEVTLNVFDNYGGNKSIAVNCNDAILNRLPSYDCFTADASNNALFDGWFVDEDCTVALTDNATPLSANISNVYAKWTSAGTCGIFTGSSFYNFEYGEIGYVDNGETVCVYGYYFNTEGEERYSRIDAADGDAVVSFKYWLDSDDSQDFFRVELCSRSSGGSYVALKTLAVAGDGESAEPKTLTVRLRDGESLRFAVNAIYGYGACIADLTVNGAPINGRQ